MTLASCKNRLETTRQVYVSDPYRHDLRPSEQSLIQALIGGIDRTPFSTKEERRAFTKAFVYDTNAIEGSGLSKKDISRLFVPTINPPKRTTDEEEAFGVRDALEWLEMGRDRFSAALVKRMHKIVFCRSKEYAGQLRSKGQEVVVKNASGKIFLRGTDGAQVQEEVKRMEYWYDDHEHAYDPVVMAAIIHNQFLTVHPFVDGNGRIARLLLNGILISNGIRPMDIELENRSEYYNALIQHQQHGNFAPTIALLAKEYERLAQGLPLRGFE